jgi:hypothetical protein
MLKINKEKEVCRQQYLKKLFMQGKLRLMMVADVPPNIYLDEDEHKLIDLDFDEYRRY